MSKKLTPLTQKAIARAIREGYPDVKEVKALEIAASLLGYCAKAGVSRSRHEGHIIRAKLCAASRDPDGWWNVSTTAGGVRVSPDLQESRKVEQDAGRHQAGPLSLRRIKGLSLSMARHHEPD